MMMRSTEASSVHTVPSLPDSSVNLPSCEITIDGTPASALVGERLIDAINRSGKELAQVCYHHRLGPIQTCDTCMVEIDGKLARACGSTVSAGIKVVTESAVARAAQHEAFDRILGN